MTSPRILPSVDANNERRIKVFIVVHHTITDPETAFARGQNLLAGNDAPPSVRVREFYPAATKPTSSASGRATRSRRYVTTSTRHSATRARTPTSRSTQTSLAGFQSWL
jgi:hypothetical protein